LYLRGAFLAASVKILHGRERRIDFDRNAKDRVGHARDRNQLIGIVWEFAVDERVHGEIARRRE